MQYVVTKEQFDKAVIKLLHSFIGKITYKREKSQETKGLMYYELYDKDKENFADIWGKGYTRKGCKRELRLYFDIMNSIEQFMPIIRKKRFAKLVGLYIHKNTGLDIDCVIFKYNFRDENDDLYDSDDDKEDYEEYKYRHGKKIR